jgi:DNA (cytosine-5)-methyltransferase 1
MAREFGGTRLHELMREAGMSTTADPKARDRLAASELGLILAGDSLGTRKRGSKAGGGTEAAFGSLAQIARTNDAAINDAIGKGLVALSLIDEYELEKDLGTSLSFTSDLYCRKGTDPIRVEVMWRSTTSRAEIANYVLTKLGNYGRAIGLLSSP